MNINSHNLEQNTPMKSANQRSTFYPAAKWITDRIGALFAIVLFSPIMLLIAIIIKWDDPKGTIIYKQIRIGQNSKKFVMYKFRSMVSNADEIFEQLRDLSDVEGKMFKMKNDPRTTRIGRIIRTTSMDELPQLFNVLIGDMSLVGPRPPLEREVKEYTLREMNRLSVKTGLTGLWQISDRNSVGFDEMLEYDFTYISQCCWLLDMKIILSTLSAIFTKKNAY